ncbi:RND transporter [Aeromicrobium ginsengisoli]|uniref:RND transporter n=1 Tax=Aeromicrobium ginsengisoli TaxID=363867 RepID=A0A5M4F8Y1_9ACTN|nr:RND transporter [Aeromicrobium ginsengisoli]KAA1394244.1 RND transporter [Aeromicrobium ginsengisoli]
MPSSFLSRVVGTTRRRSARWVLLAMGVLLVAFGLSRVTLDTAVGSFVPRSSSSYDELVERDAQFGGDPVVVVLHGRDQGGLILDQEQLIGLIGLEGDLARLPDVAVVYGPGTVLNQTAGSIQNVLAMISGRRDALMNEAQQKQERRGASKAEIQKARDQAVAAFDERYGNLIAQGLPVGLPTVRNQKFVASVLLDDDGDPRPEWSFLVPDAESATILVRPREGLDQDGADRLTRAVRGAIDDAGLAIDEPLVTGVPALSSSIANRARTEAPLLGGLALVAVGLVLWFSRWTPRRRDRLRPLLAALLGTATTLALFGLVGRPLSLGVVAFLPIILGIGSDFPLYLNQRTGRRRVLVTAAAAVAAFASLAVSPLPFVREFGIALALGLTATVGWALLLRSASPSTGSVDEASAPTGVAVRMAGRGPRRAIAAIGVAVAVAGLASLPSLRIQSSPDQLAAGLPQLADVKTAEKALGFAGEISLVVRGDDVLSPEAMAWQSRAIESIVTRHADRMRPLLTTERLLSFLGTGADAAQIAAGADLLPPYLLGGVVSADRGSSSSAFGVTIDDVADQQRLIDEIEGELDEPPSGYTADLVGLPVVAGEGLSAMESGRYLVNGVGILAAGLVLGLGLRSRRLALMGVAAALLSGGWVFAVLRVLGAELSPLTLAVGALTTVTACEFTVMLAESAERGRAWMRRSVLTAACAGTVGYACLSLSQLHVLRDFGLTLAGGVVSSYVAAQLVAMVAFRSGTPIDVPEPLTVELDRRDPMEVLA